jgi:dienelactone hydrolase
MMLAKQGYAAFAADMYGAGIFADSHEKAAELSGVYFKDRNKMRARAKAAMDAFIKTGYADEFNLSAIGYCFGGTTVLEMARAGFPLKGVVSFHGILATPAPAEAGAVKAKVLVFNGAEDAMISAQDRQSFEEEMRKAGADWQFVNLGGAKHSFTVWEANIPEKGIVYSAAADKRSWAGLKLFLNEVMVKPSRLPPSPKIEEVTKPSAAASDPIISQ